MFNLMFFVSMKILSPFVSKGGLRELGFLEGGEVRMTQVNKRDKKVALYGKMHFLNLPVHLYLDRIFEKLTEI